MSDNPHTNNTRLRRASASSAFEMLFAIETTTDKFGVVIA